MVGDMGSAGLKGAIKGAGSGAAVGALAGHGTNLATKIISGGRSRNMPVTPLIKGMAKLNAKVFGVIDAGVAGVKSTARQLRSHSQEKKAALDALVEAGVDFDEATTLVDSKARELYGE